MKVDYVHEDTLTATDYVELNKDNKLLMIYNQYLLKEKQELKKQLEDLLNQQKEFIEWLENEIQNYKDYEASFGLTIERDIAEYISEKITIYQAVLLKYKEIIGGDRK